MNIIKLKEIFRKHVEKYDIKDKNISLKLYHSFRVMDLCILLAKHYKLEKEDIEIITLIGLLHDYARFEQWDKFKTFNDMKSIDHGDLAVKRLFVDNEIEDYCKIPKYYTSISNAIKYHNKYSYPDDLSQKDKLFCQIIRDADKLDIFYLLAIDKTLLPEDNAEINDKLKEDFFNNKLLNRSNVKSHNDSIIISLAMVYDSNFDYSYKYL